MQRCRIMSYTLECESASRSSVVSGHSYVAQGAWLETTLWFSILLLTTTYEPEELWKNKILVESFIRK